MVFILLSRHLAHVLHFCLQNTCSCPRRLVFSTSLITAFPTIMTNWKKYILWFAQEHVEFRAAEIKSLLHMLDIPIRGWPTTATVEHQPYWLVELPDDTSAKRLAARSISLRCVVELWSHGHCADTFHADTRTYLEQNASYVADLCALRNSFRITVDTFNRRLTQEEKIDRIETLDYLPVLGPVDLRTPDVHWYYIEYYGRDTLRVPEQPLVHLFGRWLADGQRAMLKEISLKTRKFIGNTSMDAQLSVLMANQARVRAGDVVLDPFVGSGSLLVPAAKFGAYVMGSDIDYLMLHARTRPTRIQQKVRAADESIRANLRQYGCAGRYVDLVVSDFSKPMWSDRMLFDSIITDPPYGIREATEKVEAKKPRKKLSEPSEDMQHFPSTSNYDLSELYADLLSFAVAHLRLGGRLVCWIPIFKQEYKEAITIPKHSCLELVANSEQNISALTSRRLLTYEKIAEPVVADAEHTTEITVADVDESVSDFRSKFFQSAHEESRKVRRMQKAELKEIGRQEALNRGKRLDENGKFTTKPMPVDVADDVQAPQ